MEVCIIRETHYTGTSTTMLMMGQRGIISRVDDSELVEVTIDDLSAQSNPQVYSISRNDVARST